MKTAPILSAALATLLLAACTPSAPSAPDAGKDTAAAPATVTAPEQPVAKATTAAVPTLDLPTIDGGRYVLAEKRGKWVVVNFWATWCAPCIKEMPELSAMHTLRANVEVVGLAYEDTTAEDLLAFLQQRPVTYPVAIADPYDPPADFATPRGLPTTYLINPEGEVVHHFLGPVTAADIELKITEAGGTP